MMRAGSGRKRVLGWLGRSILMACLSLVPAFASSSAPGSAPGTAAKNKTSASAHPATKSSKSKSTRSSSRKGKRSKKVRGQQKIESERTYQIQQALIRQHYMTGEATGKWDDSTQEALRRFQADNGWQNKTVPDSRALIKLGLGPNHDHLLNPESAMTSTPETPAPTPVSRPAPTPSGPLTPANQPQQ
jgi:peptidoglycan hydrolase-like protein with peptidoglycan-binding domain